MDRHHGAADCSSGGTWEAVFPTRMQGGGELDANRVRQLVAPLAVREAIGAHPNYCGRLHSRRSERSAAVHFRSPMGERLVNGFPAVFQLAQVIAGVSSDRSRCYAAPRYGSRHCAGTGRKALIKRPGLWAWSPGHSHQETVRCPAEGWRPAMICASATAEIFAASFTSRFHSLSGPDPSPPRSYGPRAARWLIVRRQPVARRPAAAAAIVAPSKSGSAYGWR